MAEGWQNGWWRRLAVIVATLSLAGVAQGGAQAPSAGQPWLAYGDHRGHVAPCGCDPATDLGGLARLGTAVRRERIKEPKLWLFDLGDKLPDDASDDAKVTAMLEATRELEPLAALFARREQQAAEAIGAWQKKTKGSLPFVLSNAEPKAPFAGLVTEAVRGSGATVLGFVENARYTRPWSKALLAHFRSLLGKEPGTAVLLFDGSDATLRAIHEARLFSLIITTGQMAPDAAPSPIERTEPGRLHRFDGIYAVPSFGQGLLRGGSLRENGASLLGGLEPRCAPEATLFGSDCQAAGKSGAKGILSGTELVTWLDRTVAGESPLAKVVAHYDKAQADAFAIQAKARAATLKDSPFAGAQACQSCHPSAYAMWQGSRHHAALATLEAKGKSRDGECVSCHVLGFDEPGGFVSAELTPAFAGVQCETCHGPRKAHAAHPSEHPKVARSAREVCVGCHKLPHSSAFAFDRYWPKIKHGREGQADRPSTGIGR